jgi:glycine/D-amino acid oxidase-like deaminating enzyme
MRGATCLYTATPDCHFRIIDHPDVRGATVVSACSGHGFKHAAALGEAVACASLSLTALPIPQAWRSLG